MVKSEFNSVLTLEYMTKTPENKHFECKSAKKKPSDLACLVSAFANAEGGTIVIGISDTNRTIEGFSEFQGNRLNQFIAMPKDCCRPMPEYIEEVLEVINHRGEKDVLLLLHIFPSVDRVIRTINDSTYLRIADRTVELKGEDLRNLEYAKGARHYEDELNYDAEISDLDEELLTLYKKHIGAEDVSTDRVLKSRGFLKTKAGKQYLTNGAVLLFAENVGQFYANCRIRFLRFNGNIMQVGSGYNVIKDINIEEPILKIIDTARSIISGQLRSFTALDVSNGKFSSVPEYPEFAWLEAIVNAVTHREYGLGGNYIKVSMFDDRLEILSPGRLPSIVTVDNIRETRYSRNSRIARVLTEFGWVRELNEGVKRMYKEMEEFFLEDPIYTDNELGVNVVLKNNILTRNMRSVDRMVNEIGVDVWESLDDIEKSIITFLGSKKSANRAELERITNRSSTTVKGRLNKLIEIDLVKRNGSLTDPRQTYSLNI